jgi:hypothetical protein
MRKIIFPDSLSQDLLGEAVRVNLGDHETEKCALDKRELWPYIGCVERIDTGVKCGLDV